MLQFSNFRRQVRNVFEGIGEKVRGPKSLRNFGVESLELRDCPAVSFLNFAENSPTDPLPLLGTTPTIIGNSALFDPNGFQSSSNPVAPSDSTVDFLTFTVNADQGTTISKLNFTMSGDTTLTGIPASFAAAGISANAFIRVTQLQGNVAANVTTSVNLVFNPNSGQYSLANNGNIIGKIINGTAEIDINALLANNNITGKATSVDVTLNTVLITNASSNGSAFIQVKQTEVDVTTVEPLGSIGDTVFYDYNGNGVQDPGDPGVDGVKMDLIYAGADNIFGNSDDQTFQTTTAGGGKYLFSNLPLGAYQVSVDTSSAPLVGYSNTYDPDGGFDSKSFATLTLANPNNLNQDFGYAPASGQIGDTIFNDYNGNGVQDQGDTGIAGVTVTIKNTLTNLSQQMVTDANGKYLFNNLPAGTYNVTVTAGANTPLANLQQTADPDGVLNNASTVSLVGPNNLINLLQDFGYAPTNGQVGDTIYNDKDGNGQQGPNDPGIAGVTVTLVYAGKDGVFGTNDDQTIGSKVTDANGKYLFTNLLAGTYQVTVTTGIGTPLNGFVNTGDPDGGFDSKSVVALSGPNSMVNLLQDFGYQSATASSTSILSGVVYVDANNNGIVDFTEIGIAGVKLTLQIRGPQNGYTTIATTTTDSAGFYTFTSLASGVYQIVETHPVAYLDGIDTAGTLGGTALNDVITNITVGNNQIGVGYNFGERGLVTVTKKMFLASTGTLTSGTSVASGLQTLFTTSSANAPLINAYLNPTAARAQGFNASSFTSALALAGATSMSQRSRTSTGTGSTTGAGITDAHESLLDLETNEAVVDLAFDDIDFATV